VYWLPVLVGLVMGVLAIVTLPRFGWLSTTLLSGVSVFIIAGWFTASMSTPLNGVLRGLTAALVIVLVSVQNAANQQSPQRALARTSSVRVSEQTLARASAAVEQAALCLRARIKPLRLTALYALVITLALGADSSSSGGPILSWIALLVCAVAVLIVFAQRLVTLAGVASDLGSDALIQTVDPFHPAFLLASGLDQVGCVDWRERPWTVLRNPQTRRLILVSGMMPCAQGSSTLSVNERRLLALFGATARAVEHAHQADAS